jgi:nicotinamide mononucleotide transporter
MNTAAEPTSTKPQWLLIFNSWFDSFAAILMLSAVILGILRFREMWFLYFCANTIKIILFSIFIAKGNFDHASLLVIASGYFINSMYGMYIWSATRNKTTQNK